MYCIKCGVELADGQSKCPLCGTVVYHPDVPVTEAKPSYPSYVRPPMRVNHRGVMFLVTMVYVMLIIQLIICDFSISGGFVWSLYADGGLLLSYILFLLPLWFRRPNPVIFVPCDFAAIALYLLFIDLVTGGDWFLSFAFPVVGIAGIIVTTVVALVRYVRRGYFFIFGGSVIACGGYLMLLEFFLNITFKLRGTFIWSIYPLIGCFLMGMALIVIGISKPLRESLSKKFFL